MKIDLNEIEKRREHINTTKHDVLPLLIHNYNQLCQFNKAWDNFTIICRGLITDLEGNVVAMPFKKFFNYEEVLEENRPKGMPIEVTTKYDGSLIITTRYKGELVVATRGSFNSEQAKWAYKKIWEYEEQYGEQFIHEGITNLWEGIYPENRIVVDYKDRDELVLLAVIDCDGKEANREDLEVFSDVINKKSKIFSLADSWKFKDINHLMKSLEDNNNQDFEGFVLKYEDGTRLKLKTEEYVRLHKILTGFSTTSIWECMKNGEDFTPILEKVPDEFFNFVQFTRDSIQFNFDDILIQSQAIYHNVKDLDTRAKQAEYINKQDTSKIVKSVVFAMLDNKLNTPICQEAIWRAIKPEYKSPFKEGYDN